MAHHAYFYIGKADDGELEVRDFATRELDLTGDANGNIIARAYGLFSVDDARALKNIAELSNPGGGPKALIISVERMFHESQNALLKLFEEPPKDTYLFLIVPSEGILLQTLRSRLLPLPGTDTKEKKKSALLESFLEAAPATREKLITKLLDRTKSDKDEEKQAARGEALQFVEGLGRIAHEAWLGFDESSPVQKKKAETYELFLRDLNRFIPILNERSAPLKQIFEHLMIVLPVGI
jgi:hypothetical protein